MRYLLGSVLTLAAGNLVATAASAAPTDEPGPTVAVASLPVQPAVSTASTANLGVDATDDPKAGVGNDDVEVAFTPYLWMAGIHGDIGIPRGNEEVDVDRSFSDTLSDLKFAFMGTLDVEYHRFVLHTDLIYLSLSSKVEPKHSLIFDEGKADLKQTIAMAAVGYRVVDQGPMFVDLYAGGRLVSLDVDLSLDGPLQTREANASPSNVSPLIGGKARFPLGGRWALALQGDIGFDSDVKWQLAGTIQYQLGDHWRMGAGYRHLALHHDKQESEIDIALSGPLLAITYTF